MIKKCLIAVICCMFAIAVQAKPGIKSIVTFGDSLSDAGNAALLAGSLPEPLPSPFPPPYYENKASNGLVWIEVAAQAYGYDASPSLGGGMNFAFGGAESGDGLSDSGTPNFHTQIEMWQQAVADEAIDGPMPWQLFVVQFGPNDLFSVLAEPREVTPEDIDGWVANIAAGMVTLHESGARMFLVPEMPPLHLSPYGLGQSAEAQLMLESVTNGFNAGVHAALDGLEATYDKMTILRLPVVDLYLSWLDDPATFGLVNVTEPAFVADPFFLADNPNEYLSWDGFHPTAAGHTLVAQAAMDIIPIGSWWGHSVARGPGGEAWLDGLGWAVDEHWPWVFSYSLNEGVWMWTYEEGADVDGFYAYIPKGYKWIFVNAMSGWFYDYEAASWQMISP